MNQIKLISEPYDAQDKQCSITELRETRIEEEIHTRAKKENAQNKLRKAL